MKAKVLKQLLNTNYVVQEIPDKICISSYYVTDLIAIDKKTLKLTYALDTFHEGRNALKSEQLENIWDKLTQMIKDGSIKDIIKGNDSIEGMKIFYYFDEDTKKVIKSYTDEYGWPNVDYTGKLIYDNNCFETEKEAIDHGIEVLLSNLKYTEQYLNEEIERFTERTTKLNTRIVKIQEALSNLFERDTDGKKPIKN